MSRTPRPRTRRPWPVLAVALAVAVLVAGCGLSADNDPQLLDSESLPEELQPGGSPTTATTPGDADDVEQVRVWFLQGTGSDTILVPTHREVPTPINVPIVLEALFTQPPDEQEREAGTTSAIPPDTTIERWELSGDVLVLELSESFYQLEGDPSRNAFAQIVYTVTGLHSVERVQFGFDGEIVEAKDGEGEDRIEPLGRADYASLDPRRSQ
jgi:spore germination protein GerM